MSTQDITNLSDVDIVARTVYGEARGEGREGWIAVAWVIKNRADHPGWWGRTLRDVCTKPAQFSCWNFGDPNREKIIGLDAGDPLYRKIYGVVSEVVAASIPDPTAGATHYAEKTVHPEWESDMAQTAEIGNHVFFKEV